MKQSKKNMLIAALLGLAVLPFAACTTPSSGTSAALSADGSDTAVAIELPLQEYVQDTEEAFRYVATAEAMNLNAAQRSAEMNAKNGLAGKINTAIQAISESDIKTAQDDSAITTQSNFKEQAKAQVNQTLRSLKTLGTKAYRDKSDGRYIFWVAMEMNRKDAAATIANAVAAAQPQKVTPEQKAKMRVALEKAFAKK